LVKLALSRSFSATAQSSSAQIFVLLALDAQWIRRRFELAAQPAADLRNCKKGGYTNFYVAVSPSGKKQLFTVDASKAQEILDCKF